MGDLSGGPQAKQPQGQVPIAPPTHSMRPKPPEVAFAESVRDFGRFLYNSNPFYVISAALIFWGLRSSFDTTGKTFETDALMIGLAGYTLLLAVAACVLIRLGQVWDDVRTILLLVVLMLLAISVSFDKTLADDSAVGRWYYLGGLLFAVLLSEGTLRVIRLRLRWLFRIPYYLALGLFFLYPVAISSLIRDPADPALLWALFGFSPAAALVCLTLLPAVWRGPRYVRRNGSPWRWPWYPWTLFGTLAIAVAARSFYLCYSFHFVKGQASIFRPYFLAPFLLAVCVLLLEMGLRSRLKGVVSAALAAPLVVLLLCIGPYAGASGDLGFSRLFVETLGATPLYFALISLALFYCYAALRRVDHAAWGATAALAALAVIGPATSDLDTLVGPQGWPLVLAAVLQFGFTLQRRTSGHCLWAACLLVAGLAAQFQATTFTAYRGLIPVHLVLLSILVIGAVFKDPLAKILQHAGAVFLLAISLVAVVVAPEHLDNPPPALIATYPLLAATVAAVYGYLMSNPVYLLPVIGSVLAWLVKVGGPNYQKLREPVEGLDKIVLGTLFLVVALLISLAKAGLFRRWFDRKANEDEDTNS